MVSPRDNVGLLQQGLAQIFWMRDQRFWEVTLKKVQRSRKNLQGGC